MKSVLEQLARYGEIDWFSYHFAEFIATQAGTVLDDPLCLTAARLCEANLAGSVCIDLEELAGKPLFGATALAVDEMPLADDAPAWRARLLESACVDEPGRRAPLTLDGNRLYLNRFWHYEDAVASRIRALLDADDDDAATVFADLFGDADDLDASQRRAVLTAASKPFSVISGGPGSGKTSTVIRILAVLLARDSHCRVALTAPTGKAAARMQNSIRERLDGLAIDAGLRDKLNLEAQTLHRLLGYRGQSFDHGPGNPLAYDCVIVDEASMIDLRLMYQLLSALPPSVRLILLGDRDQLASVAAGNVLGDITGHGQAIDSGNADVVGAVSLLAGNYRFAGDSAIGLLANRINRGEADSAIELLAAGGSGLQWWDSREAGKLDGEVLEWVCEAYLPIFASRSAAEALDIYEASRVLCATNRGPLGVDAVGQQISATLLARAGIPATALYSGLPIMITRNHHSLGLYNGDSGILWRDDSGLRACFRSEGGIRAIPVNRLPEYTPAWTSTVHKSQGSEFDSVLLVLPAETGLESLSRELLYTAVTRARQNFLLQAPRPVLAAAIGRLTRRYSGLAGKLGWPG